MPPRGAASHFLVLAAALFVGLLPPSATDAQVTEEHLRAGAATAEITMPVGTSLHGIIMRIGPVEAVHDPLYARALVLDDGHSRLAIVICDATIISRPVADMAKSEIEKLTGLPPERVLIAATHTHSGPRVLGDIVDHHYKSLLARQIAKAVQGAIENLAPAEIGWGSAVRSDLVECRRWLVKPGVTLTNPFGETDERVKSRTSGGGDNIEPAGPVDPQLSIVAIRHTDGAPLAVLANYSVHYVGGFKYREVSADYFGYFASRVEERLGAGDEHPHPVAMMSNGTSGDTAVVGVRGMPPYAAMRDVGHSLAETAYEVIQEIEYRGHAPLAMVQRELELDIRRPDAERLAWAEAIWAKSKEKFANNSRVSLPEIYAREAIKLSEYPASEKIVMQALRIGPLCIVAIPCEVFAETGLAIKEKSPAQPTFIIQLANGYGGYLPTPEQHELGGYETWPGRGSFLEVGAEPKIRQTALELITEAAE